MHEFYELFSEWFCASYRVIFDKRQSVVAFLEEVDQRHPGDTQPPSNSFTNRLLYASMSTDTLNYKL